MLHTHDALTKGGSDGMGRPFSSLSAEMRAISSAVEIVDHIEKRKELWGMRDTEPACPTIKGPGQPKQFAADTSETTGISKRSTNRASSRAKAIPGDIRAIIKGTKLDTGVYLDSLKGMEPEDQRAKVRRDLETRPSSG